MKVICSLVILIPTLLFTGCGLAEREQKLREKEVLLTQKEQQLVAKEKELALKEADLFKKEVTLDSSRRTWDSIGIYDEALIGEWSVKMNCTETDCEGSAIGDTKTEHWAISYENNRVVAKAFSKKKLLRVYKGIYANNVLKLKEEENSTSTEIVVELIPDAKDSKRMKGTRLIIQPTCKIRYELDVERIATDNKNITNILK